MQNNQQIDFFKPEWLSEAEQNVVREAVSILDNAYKQKGLAFSSPHEVRNFCKLKISMYEHEVFAVLFLDNKHRLIEFQEIFRGTIDSCSVYPREVAKEALRLNASAVILTHNHPSGNPQPSAADRAITERLCSALQLLDIRVLDHVIVGGEGVLSFAESGWL